MRNIHDIMRVSPVIPVATIPDGSDAEALGNALVEGGVRIIEITLRSDTAVASIAALAGDDERLCVGAGTVWTADQANAVIDAGAQFIVSPGISRPVFDVCQHRSIPILPGAQTTSEIAQWVALGLTAVKFFPANYAGGVGALKSFAAVFPGLEFCPTGGISNGNAGEFLALPSVPCVGGSWIASTQDIAGGEWSAITARCRDAMSLGN